jgi:hypothetical protein
MTTNITIINWLIINLIINLIITLIVSGIAYL